ncbi:hypothetical protein CVT25_011430 [Psilocybe cyanescens]|uniref:Uncharacterized protein n=1 Tax=Psilocybe cyanescens TaxID=93625 RepID=A0A409XV87_PSICY|nr:hypothetical protein CVT25_011430 [Psilocybe cyanescens]
MAVPGEPDNPLERITFWDAPSTVQWFRDRGYTLYQHEQYELYDEVLLSTLPSVAHEEGSPAEYPYAHYDLDSENPLRAIDYGVCQHCISLIEPEFLSAAQGKVAFAQDSLNRHVAINVVRANTEELAILHFLKQQDLDTLKNNCIILVQDILPVE